MADCIDSEPASQHLPPNDMNFQRNWAASVMVNLASSDPTATLLQVVTAATRATGLRAAQTRSIYGNLKRGYAEAVRDGETPAYKYHPNARIAAQGRQQGFAGRLETSPAAAARARRALGGSTATRSPASTSRQSKMVGPRSDPRTPSSSTTSHTLAPTA